MLSNALKSIITLCLAGQAMKQTHVEAAQTRVAVYRGPATLEGTPESAADLFTSAWKDSKITYVGPKERVKVTKETLKDFDVYIQPGGGDLTPAWRDVKKYQKTIQDFVAGGGHYLGFCVGAYLAGPDEGFNLFPSGVRADQEIDQRNSQVDDEENTVIQVDWTFSSGDKQCKTEKNRWLYFQDGAAILGKVGKDGNKGKVLGRYSKSKDVAAYVVGYKKGIVGVVGPHPEADKSWYDDEEIENPTGYDLDVGRDFVRAVMEYKEGEKPCGSC